MSSNTKITTLFLDIGGVLLTNGWDRHSRMAAVKRFNLEFEEVDERHHLTFDTYEVGKISLDQYLDRVVFHKERSFSHREFKEFMFRQSRPLTDMLDFTKKLVAKHGLRTVAVSNEGKELTEHRIRTFDLNEIFNAYVSSCFVHYRKPDVDIYHMALDISQAKPEAVAYVDDRPMFVEVASSLGIHGIHHTDPNSTQEQLAELGLTL